MDVSFLQHLLGSAMDGQGQGHRVLILPGCKTTVTLHLAVHSLPSPPRQRLSAFQSAVSFSLQILMNVTDSPVEMGPARTRLGPTTASASLALS